MTSTPQRRKFLLHCFYATGHVLPMQSIAKALVDRGHDVVWLASPTQQARATASGARVVATDEIDRHDREFQAADPQTLDEIIDVFIDGRLTSQVADFRRVLLDFAPDVLLMDALPWGAAAVYELGEVPCWATLGVVPMFATEPSPRSTLGKLIKGTDTWIGVLNKQRAEVGLGALAPAAVPHYSPLLHIQASCPALEYHQTSHPTHYVGPLVSPLTNSTAGAGALPPWWDEVVAAAPSRIVVGVTQGTFALDPTSLIVPTILALQDDPRLLVVATTPHTDQVTQHVLAATSDSNSNSNSNSDGSNPNTTAAARRLPANLRLGRWVPYDALLALPHTRVFVTNGGYGSVTQALAHGVPLVCAGTSEDKKDTAARMASAGAGIDLQTECPGVDEVRAAVAAVLRDEAPYRENAARMAEALAGLGGAARACALLEEAAATAAAAR